MKRRLDRAFETLTARCDDDDVYHTAIEKGLGQRSGLPDRFYAAFGGHCFVEAKVLPNKLSTLQEQVIKILARAGTRVAILSLEVSSDQLLLSEVDSCGTIQPRLRFRWLDVRRKPFWSMLLQNTSGVYCPGGSV